MSIRSAAASGDKLVQDAVREATLDVVRKGLAEGPFSAEELDAHFGPRWVGCRRFGVRQGTKVRPVDDMTECGVNARA